MWTHNLDAELWFNNIYLSYCIFVFIYSDVRQRCELIYQQTASPCTICRNIVYITTQLDSYNYFWRNECISDNYWTIAGLASYFIPYEEIRRNPLKQALLSQIYRQETVGEFIFSAAVYPVWTLDDDSLWMPDNKQSWLSRMTSELPWPAALGAIRPRLLRTGA